MAGIRHKRNIATTLGALTMEMDEEKRKQLEFVMRIGTQMRNYMTDCLIKTFDTHEERCAAFYSLLINFVANAISEVSTTERLRQNVEEIIEGLQQWLDGTENMIIKFHQSHTTALKKEDLH